MDNLAENCGMIKGNGATPTSAKIDAADPCLQHEPATNDHKGVSLVDALSNSNTPLPIGNLNTTAYKPKRLDIVLWRGECRIVFVIMSDLYENDPRVQLRYYNGSEGFHDPVYAMPDELTPVGLAAL